MTWGRHYGRSFAGHHIGAILARDQDYERHMEGASLALLQAIERERSYRSEARP